MSRASRFPGTSAGGSADWLLDWLLQQPDATVGRYGLGAWGAERCGIRAEEAGSPDAAADAALTGIGARCTVNPYRDSS